ncbi:MAG: uroporphyrinogen-III C-methyltransferase [Planctomycetes bacterium]|nr:uroporphyrinogen-III C-methyltransferase [Planctomycetota bacterium]MBU1518841.1 uroporphyrinogen-III C-methyltransferase [Planctomycetota bacterium]
MNKKPKIYIIGAGPGSGGLISVRALQILQRADCVLYDRLIGPELLNLVPKTAELLYVGKEHTARPPKQKDINRLIIKKSRIHKTIVRLKGGDAMIFGRATEELKCLISNNIDFEIIPGITAASAAAACAGLVLTDRNTASAVTFITGHTADGKEVDIDFKSLAKLNGTIVFYMAVGNMKHICHRLVKSDLSAHCKATVVANASLANQKIVKGTVANIAEKCEKNNITPPAVMIIGKNCFSRLQHRPLFGKKVLMTRDSVGNAAFACKLAARGACAVSCPTFEIHDLTGKKEVKQIIPKIKNFDWVFFTSPTGVKLFFAATKRLNKDSRFFASAKIACIGAETATALEDFNINADFVPKIFTSDKLAKGFIKKYKPAGKKILLLRSALADSVLTAKLKSAKAKVKTVSIYTAEKLSQNCHPERSEGSIDENIDWLTFASSFAVKCFFEDIAPETVRKIKIASIGPTVTETLKKIGVKPTVQAKEHTIDGLIEAMEKIRLTPTPVVGV